MTEWPKNPQLHVGGNLEPDGPVNIFNEKLAVADAINRAVEVKTKYDETHPPTTEPPPPAPAAPLGEPIGPGSPVVIEESRYMIDVAVSAGRRRR